MAVVTSSFSVEHQLVMQAAKPGRFITHYTRDSDGKYSTCMPHTKCGFGASHSEQRRLGDPLAAAAKVYTEVFAWLHSFRDENAWKTLVFDLRTCRRFIPVIAGLHLRLLPSLRQLIIVSEKDDKK